MEGEVRVPTSITAADWAGAWREALELEELYEGSETPRTVTELSEELHIGRKKLVKMLDGLVKSGGAVKVRFAQKRSDGSLLRTDGYILKED